MASSTIAFTGVPSKTVNPRLSNPDPFSNTYQTELEKINLRKQRFLQSREKAKRIENDVQERYRLAMIANVEKELFRRKAQYEQQKQAQLDSLRTLYAQSMRMLGHAQKGAINVINQDTEQALQHAKVWETLADTTLQRGNIAIQEENLSTSQSLYTNDEQIYRTEVMKAAALHHRRNARRLSTATTATVTHSSSSSSASSSTVPSIGDRYGNPLPHQPPRESPFYGPYGIQETNHLVTKETIVSSTLQRVQQKGPVSETSVIRVPVLTMKTTDDYKQQEENAYAAGQRSAETFEQQRLRAGNEARNRAQRAQRRGSSAGRQLREQREGMHLLHELERLDSENRVLSIQHDQHNQQMFKEYQQQQREQQRRYSVPSSVASSVGGKPKPKEEPSVPIAEESVSLMDAIRNARASLPSKEHEHNLEDVQRMDDTGELAEQLIEEEFTKAQHLEHDLQSVRRILAKDDEREARITEGKRMIMGGTSRESMIHREETERGMDTLIRETEKTVVVVPSRRSAAPVVVPVPSTVPSSMNHPLLYQPYTVPNEDELANAFEDTLVGDMLMMNNTTGKDNGE